MHVPRIQVFRFASSELAPVVNKLWASGIENPDVRELLLEVVEAGKLTLCADVCFSLAINSQAQMRERIAALEALIALNDPRLSQISESMHTLEHTGSSHGRSTWCIGGWIPRARN
ncbi:MAG: hypothetical protein AB7K64_06880 [Variibacter sp.]